MSKINVNTMVTVKLTPRGKREIVAVGEDSICMGDTIHCTLGMLMEVFGNACFCSKEQEQLFVDNEITIIGELSGADYVIQKSRDALGDEYTSYPLPLAVKLMREEIDRLRPEADQLRQIREALEVTSSVSLPAIVRRMVRELGLRRRAHRDARRAMEGDYADVTLADTFKALRKEIDRLRKAARPDIDLDTQGWAKEEVDRSLAEESDKAIEVDSDLLSAVRVAREYIRNLMRQPGFPDKWKPLPYTMDLLDSALRQADQPVPHVGTESQAPRFRVTTNGEKFRVEERQLVGYRDPSEWRWVHVGGPGQSIAIAMGWKGYDTRPQAEYAKAERIRATEKAAQPWVPVEEGTTTQQPEREQHASTAWATLAVLAASEARRLIGQHWPLPFPSIGKEPVELRLRTLEMLSSVIDRAAKGEAACR